MSKILESFATAIVGKKCLCGRHQIVIESPVPIKMSSDSSIRIYFQITNLILTKQGTWYHVHSPEKYLDFAQSRNAYVGSSSHSLKTQVLCLDDRSARE